MQLYNAEEVSSLLLAALPGLMPGQHRLCIPLILNPRDRVSVPTRGSCNVVETPRNVKVKYCEVIHYSLHWIHIIKLF